MSKLLVEIAMVKKCVDATFVPFCDLACQVGRVWPVRLVGGSSPTNPVLASYGRHSQVDPVPAGFARPRRAKAGGNLELGLPILVRQNASVGDKPRTDGPSDTV